MMEGKADYKPSEGFEDRWHVVGEGDNPVYICRKGDIPSLFSDEFYFCFEVWRYFNAGFGLPGRKPWDEQDPDLMEAVMSMENHFKNNFSMNLVIIKYMEAIIKRMDARAKAGI
jgi:hypothetical protein